MTANSFGQILRFTSFGESHGPGLGVVIEGLPSGLMVDLQVLNEFMQRRRPGSSVATSGRNETDECEILSGVFDGKTLGTPIAVIVRNKDARSGDYDQVKDAARPGHADDVWKQKFAHVDHRGGGRSSGRETLARVIAGAFAKMLVQKLSPETSVYGFPLAVGPLKFSSDDFAVGALKVDGSNVAVGPVKIDGNNVAAGPVKVDRNSTGVGAQWNLNAESVKKIDELLAQAKVEGQSYGGVAQVIVENPAAGLGQPVFRKLKSDLAMLVMSLGATQAFELGEGFEVTEREGVDFHSSKDQKKYGGIRGGITTGETIQYKVAFKPTSSVMDVAKRGRHDPCIVLRALVVLEAMTWFALADHILWRRLDNV